MGPYFMERVMGIEPTRPAWKAGVLPLNYTRENISQYKSGGADGIRTRDLLRDRQAC